MSKPPPLSLDQVSRIMALIEKSGPTPMDEDVRLSIEYGYGFRVYWNCEKLRNAVSLAFRQGKAVTVSVQALEEDRCLMFEVGELLLRITTLATQIEAIRME